MRLLCFFPDGIQCSVDDTAHEVRFEGAVLVELPDALKGADKSVLYHIFRHGFIMGDQEGCPDCFDLVTGYQNIQPPNIRMFQSVDGLHIIHSALPWFMKYHINYTDKRANRLDLAFLINPAPAYFYFTQPSISPSNPFNGTTWQVVTLTSPGV